MNARIKAKAVQLRRPGAFSGGFTLLTLALAAADVAAQGAAAGTESPEQAQTQSPNSVVITATRRREPAREVPMQVTRLSAEQLQAEGNRGLTDYLSKEPGVSLNTQTGSTTLSVRGVTTGLNGGGATVGTYIDDVPFGSSTVYGDGTIALDLGLLDLGQIELLRGPQGTLYGAGAMGGLLKYVSNEPETRRFSGLVGLRASSSKGGTGHTVNAVLNVPLVTDTAAVRVSAYRDSDPGMVRDVGVGGGAIADGGTQTGGRVNALFKPSPELSVRLGALVQETKRDGYAEVDYDFATGQPRHGDLKQQRALPQPYKNRNELYSATLQYDFGFARLESITAQQKIGRDQRSDFSALYVPLLAGFGVIVDTVGVKRTTEIDKTSQEFRLTSPASKTFDWLAGVFYTREKAANDQALLGYQPVGDPLPLVVLALPSRFKESALYGSASYHATPALSLTAGVRHSRNDQVFSNSGSGPLAPPNTPETASSDSSTTYLLSARYKLDGRQSVYARAASGYRPGGPMTSLVDPATGQPFNPPSFEPDTLWSYEAGYKADLMENRLSVSATAFQIRWNNIQVPAVSGGVGIIKNGGRARVEGIELAAGFRPVDAWNFSGSMTALKPRLTEDAPDVGGVAGERLPDSPRFAATLKAEYLFALGGRDGNVGLTHRYVGERQSSFAGNVTTPSFTLPAYQVTDFQAGLQARRYTVSFYVRNLFDERGLLSAGTFLAPSLGIAQVTVTTPRTVGLVATYNF